MQKGDLNAGEPSHFSGVHIGFTAQLLAWCDWYTFRLYLDGRSLGLIGAVYSSSYTKKQSLLPSGVVREMKKPSPKMARKTSPIC